MTEWDEIFSVSSHWVNLKMIKVCAQLPWKGVPPQGKFSVDDSAMAFVVI